MGDFVISPIMFTADLRAQGVHTREIADRIEHGELYRAARGVLVTPGVYVDQDLEPALASHLNGGILALLSAAVRHGLCDASPPYISLIVPAMVARGRSGLPVSLLRTRSEKAQTIGIETHDFHGLEWRVTDPARTIVDLYRITPDVYRQHAVAALTTFLRDSGDEGLLHEYAEAFDAWPKLQAEVEAINETYARGMRP